MILMIDNYDSFTYNLYQYIGAVNPDVRVIRNDRINLDEIAALRPERIIISPGPGHPDDAGICVELIKRFAPETPILGVCLGHQAIGRAYGGTVSRSPVPMHGKSVIAEIDTDVPLFHGLDKFIEVGRYHSLSIMEKGFPAELRVIAAAPDGCIMAVKHRVYNLYGVQFHPESVLTPQGDRIVENFINLIHNEGVRCADLLD